MAALAARLLLLALLLLPARAAADPFDHALAGLASSAFADRQAAIEILAATPDPRSAAVLQALDDGSLQLQGDGLPVIVREDGGEPVMIDPRSLEPIGPAAGLQRLRLNNQLRLAVRNALGRVRILSPDPAERLAAAEAVRRSPGEDVLPLLEEALAAETDAGVRSAMSLALATARLASPEPQVRLSGVLALDGALERDVRVLLRRLVDGEEEDPAVRAAAQQVLAGIERRMAAYQVAGHVFQGASLGSVLLLAAIGLAITFGVMGVINMAHGEMVMLGAYTTFLVQRAFTTWLPAGWFDLSMALALPAAFLVAALVGVLIERTIIRHLYGRPLETLLATWGLSLILQQLVRSLFGPTNQRVANPSFMTGALDLAGGVVLTYNRIWIIVFSLVVLTCLLAVLRFTSFGLEVRAVTQNRRMASAMGVRTGRIDAMTFALGSGIAGLAGVALSQIDNVSPNLGQAYIIDSFMVVVFGGVGNLFGTLAGAMTLGMVNKLLEPYAGAVFAKVLVLILIILFIQKRPRGLFALRGRAAEA